MLEVNNSQYLSLVVGNKIINGIGCRDQCQVVFFPTCFCIACVCFNVVLISARIEAADTIFARYSMLSASRDKRDTFPWKHVILIYAVSSKPLISG